MDQSMTIERLGPIDPIRKYNNAEPVREAKSRGEADSIHVSNEAKVRAELMNAIELAKDVPEIRHDRVAEVQRKLQDPSYIDDRIIAAVADEIVSLFDIS
jgi:negative regulator of flagellin synthesis FlgM